MEDGVGFHFWMGCSPLGVVGFRPVEMGLMTHEQRLMNGLAECPHCGAELEAPLAAAYRTARCSTCQEKFMLPSAQVMFNNAALYLMTNEVERTVNDDKSVEDLRFEALAGETTTVDWTSRKRKFKQAM